MPAHVPQVCEESSLEIQFHIVTLTPQSQGANSEKLMMPCGVADAAVLTRIDDTGQERNGVTVLEQLLVKVGHYSAGQRCLTLLIAASSRRFCEAVRGLQVVCYGCSLGNSDKAARAFQVHSLPGKGRRVREHVIQGRVGRAYCATGCFAMITQISESRGR